jgi:hypothetical protein
VNVDGKNMYVQVIRTDSTLIDYIEILKKPEPPIPDKFYLSQNFPNPFNPSTTIRYSVPADSYLTLQVFDALGSLVATLVDEQKSAGTYDLEFSINNIRKNIISSGVYFYQLRAGNFSDSRKFIILK